MDIVENLLALLLRCDLALMRVFVGKRIYFLDALMLGFSLHKVEEYQT